ncbi:MAG: hypothetical protein RCG15_04230 [Candidatus Rickettsia vulgarisii]
MIKIVYKIFFISLLMILMAAILLVPSIERINKLDSINNENLLSGKLEMKKHQVVFTGIARDNALDLPSVIFHI